MLRRRLLSRPLLIGRMRYTAALLLLTQDARRRPRLGMVPATAAAGNRHRGRRRSSASSAPSRVFEIVEQVVELAVPFGVAERRRLPRLKRRHRSSSVRCPRCLQRKGEGGWERQQMCTARAPAQVFGAEGDRGIFGADSPTHSVTTHTLSLPPLPSSPAHVATYHRFVTFVLAPFKRFAPCQKPARRRNLQRSPELAPGLSHAVYGRYTMHSKGNDRSHRTEQKYLRRRHFLRNKGSGQEDKFFSRWGGRSGRRISGD